MIDGHEYGIVGDGVTDDYLALQAAIDAAMNEDDDPPMVSVRRGSRMSLSKPVDFRIVVLVYEEDWL